MSYDIGPTTLDEYRLALDNANERTRAALAERDAADAHRLTFREEAERVLAEHRARAEAAEAELAGANAIIAEQEREEGVVAALTAERDAARAEVEALREAAQRVVDEIPIGRISLAARFALDDLRRALTPGETP